MSFFIKVYTLFKRVQFKTQLLTTAQLEFIAFTTICGFVLMIFW